MPRGPEVFAFLRLAGVTDRDRGAHTLFDPTIYIMIFFWCDLIGQSQNLTRV